MCIIHVGNNNHVWSSRTVTVNKYSEDISHMLFSSLRLHQVPKQSIVLIAAARHAASYSEHSFIPIFQTQNYNFWPDDLNHKHGML